MQKQDQSEKNEIHEKNAAISEGSLNENSNTTKEVREDEDAREEAHESDSAAEEIQARDEEHTTDEGETMTAQARHGGFDWPALLVALVVAAFFALTARFNSQPSPSYIPAAVFSATGCGLLVTAIHKLRARARVGLLEAGLAGFGLALLQFVVTFTYPGVTDILTAVPGYSRAFLVTWSLVALCAMILSLAGATIGHLAFAPLRPLPARASRQQRRPAGDEEDDGTETEEREPDNTSASAAVNEQDDAITAGDHTPDAPEQKSDTEQDEMIEQQEKEEEEWSGEDGEIDENEGEEDREEQKTPVAAGSGQPQRPLLSYAIVVLLLGLLPMMAGYVFAAAYDFLMNALNVNSISPALYPTLSLLGGLLPWRLAAPINLSSANGTFIVFTLLWRVPDSVLGNPNLFDVQALEPLLFTATGLAFLLITMYKKENHANQQQSAPLGVYLLLEALLGLILILPANLWLLRGLEGVLELQNLIAPLPTVHLLNPTLFVLNLATGVLFCLVVALIVRRQYQLWTAPRAKSGDQRSS